MSVFPLDSEGERGSKTPAAHHRPEPDGRSHPAGPGEEAQPRITQAAAL